MDLAAVSALGTERGRALVDLATSRYADEGPLALATSLRRDHPAGLVAAALTQARLRLRAGDRVDAEDLSAMLLTADGLEQATRPAVARHRARRLAAALPAGAHVLDLGCGIGADLVALCRAGLRVTGVERDPVTAAVARHNVAALGLDARVLLADATEVDRSPYAAVFCDPARRAAGRRLLDPQAWSPPWPFVRDLLAGPAAVKVAPGIDHALVPVGTEAEWVSDAGDLVEACLWSGRLAGGPHRRATLLPGEHSITEADDPGPRPGRGVADVLYEPDDAVIRAGLVTAVAAQVGGWLPDPRIAYVTSPAHVPTPFARAYAVREQLPYDLRRLRSWVREHDVGTLVVKKRGVQVRPEELRAGLRPRGSAEATLVVTRVADRAAVLVVEPIPRR